MSHALSIVIPVRNGARTLAACLASVVAEAATDAEIIVVDDASMDATARIVGGFSCCRLVRCRHHVGTARARDLGAGASCGRVLFFLDADCVLPKGTGLFLLELARQLPAGEVVGGTYLPKAMDDAFCSHFQAAFVHWSETRHNGRADYLAGHALMIRADDFAASGGFAAASRLPLLEDVAFCHRLRRRGLRLAMEKRLQVGHIFCFTLAGSFRNAFTKARYWVRYSWSNGDLAADSGSASHALKAAGIAAALGWLLIGIAVLFRSPALAAMILPVLAVSCWLSRDFLRFLYREGDARFTMAAAAYYLFLYPLPVLAGGIYGLAESVFGRPASHSRTMPVEEGCR